MILQMYAVLDVKAKAYLSPFFMVHDGEALRRFSDAVNNKESQFCKHPEDYSLYRLGTLDDVSGELSSEQKPHYLSKAIDFIEKL